MSFAARNGQQRVKHEVDFNVNLLTDPMAMQEWLHEVVARSGHERTLEVIPRALQIEVILIVIPSEWRRMRTTSTFTGALLGQ